MGAYLSFSINESSVKPADNTSVVKVTLYVHSNSGSWNGSSRSGYIQIDGTKYSFSSSFKANTTTTLATKSKTVKHDSDGGGKITIKGYYSTGVSAGNISKTTTHKLKQIDRTSTVKYNVNGGSGSISSQTKTYGKTLTLTTSKPTRTGYTFVNWNTKADGSGTSYASGGSYTANSDVTLYAQWTPNKYIVRFHANGGIGEMEDILTEIADVLVLTLQFMALSSYSFEYLEDNIKREVEFKINRQLDRIENEK